MAIDVNQAKTDVKEALAQAMSNAYGESVETYEEFAGIIADQVAGIVLQHVKDNAVAKDGTPGGGFDLDID